MSALNVTQDEADVLIAGLKMYATVHENASGVVPTEVATLLEKLAPTPEPVVEEVVQEVVQEAVEQPENEPTEEQVEAHFAEIKDAEDE